MNVAQALAEVRVGAVQHDRRTQVAQELDLGVLAAEAENSGAGHVGVRQVACEQSAQGACILAGAAAAQAVIQELNRIFDEAE